MTLTAAQIALARAMPEEGRGGLQAQVADMCRDLGLLYYHTFRAQHSPAGFPDCVIVGANGMIYRELKRVGKRPSPAQQVWLDALAAQGCDVDVWTPAQLFNGVIVETLRKLGALPPEQLAAAKPPPRRPARR